MTPSITESDSLPGKTGFEFSVGQRQIAALGFVAVLVLGCVATVAYLAGRVAGPRQDAVAANSSSRRTGPSTQSVPAPAQKAEPRPHVEQLIVVEPASTTAVPAQPKPVAPSPAPVKAPELKPVAQELLAGNTFWQVAATDRGMSEVTLEVLTRKGLPTLLSEGPSSGILRVLVGPIRTPEESARTKAVLDDAGFHPFIKKY